MSGLYKVERITGKRKTDRGFFEYKVKWQGYADSQSTWEPVKNLKNVQGMIQDFEERNAHKMAQGLKAKLPIRSNKEKTVDHVRERSKDSSREDIGKERREVTPIRGQTAETRKVGGDKKSSPIKQKLQIRIETQTEPSPAEPMEAEQSQVAQQVPSKKVGFQGGAGEKEQLRVLGMERTDCGQIIFYVQDQFGLQSYKPHSYMTQEHPMQLIRFYESRIKFVQ